MGVRVNIFAINKLLFPMHYCFFCYLIFWCRKYIVLVVFYYFCQEQAPSLIALRHLHCCLIQSLGQFVHLGKQINTRNHQPVLTCIGFSPDYLLTARLLSASQVLTKPLKQRIRHEYPYPMSQTHTLSHENRKRSTGVGHCGCMTLSDERASTLKIAENNKPPEGPSRAARAGPAPQCGSDSGRAGRGGARGGAETPQHAASRLCARRECSGAGSSADRSASANPPTC